MLNKYWLWWKKSYQNKQKMTRQDLLNKLGIKESTYGTYVRERLMEHPPKTKEFGKPVQYHPDSQWFKDVKKAITAFKLRPRVVRKKGVIIDGNSWADETKKYMDDIGEKR